MGLIRNGGLENIKLAEAESILRRALETQIKTQGDGKLEQQFTHFTLAEVLEEQGKLDEAELHYRAALEIARNVNGVDKEDFPCTAGLAGVLRKKGKLAEARQLAEEAVAICQRRTGRVAGWVRDRSFSTLKDVLTDLGDTNALEKLNLTNQTDAMPEPSPTPEPPATQEKQEPTDSHDSNSPQFVK